MKKQSYDDPQPGFSHEALQAMALTMADYDFDTIREIYLRLNLRLTPVEKDMKKWMANNWITGNASRYYGTIHVSKWFWSNIMRTIQPGQEKQLMQLPMKRGERPEPFIQQFANAFLNFVHGQPYEEQVRQLSWSEFYILRKAQTDIVFHMAHQPENAGFMKYLDQSILMNIYDIEYADRWLNFESVESENMLREVYWENESLDEKLRLYTHDCYLFNAKLLHTGDIQATLEKTYPTSTFHLMLSVFTQMQEGRYAESLQKMSAILKHLKSDSFVYPLSNFAYAIALGMAGTPQAQNNAINRRDHNWSSCPPRCYTTGSVN